MSIIYNIFMNEIKWEHPLQNRKHCTNPSSSVSKKR